MARYAQVTIGDVVLTQTGMDGGRPCKIEIPDLAIFDTTKTGQVLNSADGTPYAQLLNIGHKGKIFEVKTDWMTVAIYNAIKLIHETAKNTPNGITVEVVNDIGTYTLGTVPLVPNDIGYEKVSNGYVKGAVFRYSVT